MAQWKAYIRENDYGHGVDLFVGEVLDNSYGGITHALIKPDGGHIMQSIVNDGTYQPTPPFLDGQMAHGFIQAVMDAAWAKGYRPTGISGERGEIKRLEEHLADMRAITFGKIGAEKP